MALGNDRPEVGEYRNSDDEDEGEDDDGDGDDLQ